MADEKEKIVLNKSAENIYLGAKSTMSGEMLEAYFDTPSENLEGVLRGPDIAAIEDARNMLTVKLDVIFGKKGLWGFGALPGDKSVEWLALKGKTIGELLADKSGNESIFKIRNLVGGLSGSSGQIPRRSELVEKFIKRTLIEIARSGKEKTIQEN
ncbi:MAG: hypothetical protein AAB488_01985 [Patescibacteria group bacterium]